MMGGRVGRRGGDKRGEGGGGGGRESPEIDRYVEDLFFNMIQPASNKVTPAKERKPQKDDVYVIPTTGDGEEQHLLTAPSESSSSDSSQLHSSTLRESTPYPRQRPSSSSSTLRKTPSPYHRKPSPSPSHKPPQSTAQLSTLAVDKLGEALPEAREEGLVVDPLMPMAHPPPIFNNTHTSRTGK